MTRSEVVEKARRIIVQKTAEKNSAVFVQIALDLLTQGATPAHVAETLSVLTDDLAEQIVVILKDLERQLEQRERESAAKVNA